MSSCGHQLDPKSFNKAVTIQLLTIINARHKYHIRFDPSRAVDDALELYIKKIAEEWQTEDKDKVKLMESPKANIRSPTNSERGKAQVIENE